MEALPNELLLEIIKHLFLEAFSTALNIGLVNRRLHHLTNELLYSTYSLNRGNPALLIRTLASWPAHARRIKSLEWDCRPAHNNSLVTSDAFPFPGDLAPMERCNIAKALCSKNPYETDDLNSVLMDAGTDAYLNLFLSFAPDVCNIRIAIPSKWSYYRIWFTPALDLRILSNLNKAYIAGPMRIRNVVPLFLLPSLRSLTLDHVAHDRNRVLPGTFKWYQYDAAIQRLRKERSWVESFHLQKCSTDTVEIAQLMSLFGHLKTFEFEFTGHDKDEANTTITHFVHSIANQSNSLTSLFLKDFRLALDPTALKGLGKFEHMDFFLLDMTMMCGSYLQNTTVESLSSVLQHLPKRLQHLHLIANDPDGDELKPSTAFTEALHAIAPIMKSILPALHTIKIVDWDPLLGTFTCQTQVKAIQLAFAEIGVDFLWQPLDIVIKESNENDIITWEGKEEGWVWIQWVNSDELWNEGRNDV
ncbi:hypothetical protein COCVIDRAFT_86758 [Bipolaris victoriae FI3]|uniref:F-box domain-containing protein n=1 Tax=Bipolaris victoriae (strain FI3) TaxID=930091 RepID=W7F0L3_BIPV3|nr:hypothetical protein COCVIDRAFT_86758 [Bipolaris victoriae FI3]